MFNYFYMCAKIIKFKQSLNVRMDWWNGFLFVWSLMLLLGAIITAAMDFMAVGRWLLWLALAAFIASKSVRVVQILFVEKGFYFAQLVYLLAVNLALGGGAAYILTDLVMRHYGF